MQSLATVVADVKEGRRPPWPCHPRPSDLKLLTRPQTDELTEVHAFGGNPGDLRMLKAVPGPLRRSAPLVVVLHGCGQTAADIDTGGGWSALAAKCGFALLLPEQRRSNNPQRGFNWFRPLDVRRDSGEALSIRHMIERMILDHGLDRKRVFIAGLSAGGAMTGAMLAAYPEVFAGGAIIAGLPYGVASNVWQAVAAMKSPPQIPSEILGEKVKAASGNEGPWPKLSIWHGGADTTVSPANADAIARQWLNVHGLSEDAAFATRVKGQTRLSWHDASGAAKVESFIIPGMAHGTPVDVAAKKGKSYGSAGPFFEDAAISSTYHIAKFWGLKQRWRSL